MKKFIKRILAVTLMLSLFITPIFSVSAATIPEEEVMPLYNNTVSANTTMSISSSGKMTISYNLIGISSKTTKIVITTYIEKKKLGLFWSRVDNGQPDKQWVTTINSFKYTGSRSYQLSSSGTYRVTVKYKVYGSGGAADEITQQKKASY